MITTLQARYLGAVTGAAIALVLLLVMAWPVRAGMLDEQEAESPTLSLRPMNGSAWHCSGQGSQLFDGYYKDKYGEIEALTGLVGRRGLWVMKLLVNPETESWTLALYGASGLSCMVATGIGIYYSGAPVSRGSSL